MQGLSRSTANGHPVTIGIERDCMSKESATVGYAVGCTRMIVIFGGSAVIVTLLGKLLGAMGLLIGTGLGFGYVYWMIITFESADAYERSKESENEHEIE